MKPSLVHLFVKVLKYVHKLLEVYYKSYNKSLQAPRYRKCGVMKEPFEGPLGAKAKLGNHFGTIHAYYGKEQGQKE